MAMKNRLEDLVKIIENIRSEGLKEVSFINNDIEREYISDMSEDDKYRLAARTHMSEYDVELENLIIDIMKGE